MKKSKELKKDEPSFAPIDYLDDGTFEVLSDPELLEVVGGIGAEMVPPPNTGCNSGCPVDNSGCG